MKIKTIKVGILETNCYIVEKDNNCIIIDPGDEFLKICKYITCKPLCILVTHRHFDHMGAIEKLKSKYQIPVFDYTNLKEGKMLLNVFDFEVIFTPGHTDDSVTYYFKEDDVMFTGDFIFKESIGRTDLETGDDLKMKMSLKKIKTYPDTTKIYPGHGMSSTLEYEKQKNIYLSEGFYD